VATQSDSDTASIQCRCLPLSFHVFNMLRVSGAENEQKKG
jgi:hypothetical protein